MEIMYSALDSQHYNLNPADIAVAYDVSFDDVAESVLVLRAMETQVGVLLEAYRTEAPDSFSRTTGRYVL